MAAVVAILDFQLAIFDLQVTPMLPTKFKVNKPFDSGQEAKSRFLRWLPWQTSRISDQKDFSYFDVQVNLMLPTKFRVNWLFQFRRRSEK